MDGSLRLLIGACIYVAFADRELDREERRVLVELIDKRVALPPGTVDRFIVEVLTEMALEEPLEWLREAAQDANLDATRDALVCAVEEARSHGVHQIERERVREVADALGFDAGDADALLGARG
ncbi:MAG: TerB family tellurite resistance protein [Sandaracinaceae bacterium]